MNFVTLLPKFTAKHITILLKSGGLSQSLKIGHTSARKFMSYDSSNDEKNITIKRMEDSIVKEGKAEIYQQGSVFYNPVQEFNRDLTIAVISEFSKDRIIKLKEKQQIKQSKEQENKESVKEDGPVTESSGKAASESPVTAEIDGMKVLEGLSASGLRSIRFAHELPNVKQIIANDFDQTAVEYIKKNISHNKVEDLVTANYGDASMVMYMNKGRADRFDVIDLDPYGSAAQFLDAAVQAVTDDGLLCVTCTDAAVLCGVTPETCSAKYGSVPIKTKFCHESALRILLQCIESRANQYSRYIEPLISLSADFYFRVFVKVHTSPKTVKQSCTKSSYYYVCGGCGAFHLQPVAVKTQTTGNNFKYSAGLGPVVQGRCVECNSHHRMAGPLWTDPIHNTDFLHKVITAVKDDSTRFNTSSRIIGTLSVMSEELPDVPFYYDLDTLMSKFLSTSPKSSIIRSALLNAGFRESESHASKNALKTDAPVSAVYDIVRCWVKENPSPSNKLKSNLIAKTLNSKEPSLIANFEIHPLSNSKSKTEGLLRFQVNPTRNWGPKLRAKLHWNETVDAKRNRGQLKANEKKEKKRKEMESMNLKEYDCKRFKDGDCELGDDCQYNHGTKETS